MLKDQEKLYKARQFKLTPIDGRTIKRCATNTKDGNRSELLSEAKTQNMNRNPSDGDQCSFTGV